MQLKEILRKAEIAAFEIAAGDDEWWNSLSKVKQKAYITEHPNSKYAKKAGTSKPSAKADGPKLRGPRAFKGEEKQKTVVKDKPKAPAKTTKDNTKDKKTSVRTKRTAMSNKEKIKHGIARIKNLQERLVVLAAEKAYRNAAKNYTKRDTTKERISDRIKKISELTKTIQVRIKNYEKHIKTLSN